MPAEMERNLRREALKKFGSTTSERARKYIFGTMRKTGWTPSTQKKKKKKKSGGGAVARKVVMHMRANKK